MWPVVTDGVAWSVGLSQSWALQKTAELIEMPYELRTPLSPRNHLLMRSRSPLVRGNFEVGRGELCKNGWTNRDVVWDLNSGGPKQALLSRVHTVATWRIPLNHPRVAAMRPIVELLWPLVVVIRYAVAHIGNAHQLIICYSQSHTIWYNVLFLLVIIILFIRVIS